MQRILIVEDEVKVANAVRMGLEENGFEVEVAYDGRMGKSLATSGDYDLVILDLNLPTATDMKSASSSAGATIKCPSSC